MGLNAVKPYQPTRADLEHEKRLQAAMKRHMNAETREEQAKTWRTYQRLHRQRSPEYVRHLELIKGLRN